MRYKDVRLPKSVNILAVAGMNRDQEIAAIEELMRLDRMPTSARLRDGSTNFLELLKAAGSDANTRVKKFVVMKFLALGAMPQIQVR